MMKFRCSLAFFIFTQVFQATLGDEKGNISNVVNHGQYATHCDVQALNAIEVDTDNSEDFVLQSAILHFITGCNETEIHILSDLAFLDECNQEYLAKDLKTLEYVVLKTTTNLVSDPPPYAEAQIHIQIYNLLKESGVGDKGIRIPRPSPYTFPAPFSQAYTTETLGPATLNTDLRNFLRQNPITCIEMIGFQLFGLVNMLQKVNALHRNWKPRNIVFGSHDTREVLHITAFRNAIVVDETVSLPVPAGEQNSTTYPFCSYSTQKHGTTTWKDEYQAVLWILIYFIRGNLPWYNLNLATPHKPPSEEYVELKSDLLAALEGVPGKITILAIFEYLRALDNVTKPDIGVLNRFLADMILEVSITHPKDTSVDSFATVLDIPLQTWYSGPVYTVEDTDISSSRTSSSSNYLFITQDAFCRIRTNPNELYFTDLVAIRNETKNFVMTLPGREEFLKRVGGGSDLQCVLVLNDDSPLPAKKWEILGYFITMTKTQFASGTHDGIKVQASSFLIHANHEGGYEGFIGTKLDVSSGNEVYTEADVQELRKEILDIQETHFPNRVKMQVIGHG